MTTDPAPSAEKDARHPYRWVACSIPEFGHVGEQRHLAPKGALTTYCGHSATHPDIWRRDSRKPKCPTCEAVETNVLTPEQG